MCIRDRFSTLYIGFKVLSFLGGVLSDITGGRAVYVMLTAPPAMLLAAASLAPSPLLLAIIYVSLLATDLAQPGLTAILVSSVPRDALGTYFSIHRMVVLTALAASSSILSLVYESLSLRALMWASCALLTASLAAALLLREERGEQRARRATPLDSIKLVSRHLRALSPYILVVVLATFLTSVAAPFTRYYVVEVLGLSFLAVGLYESASSLASLASQIPAGRAVDRFGERVAFTASFAANALSMLLFLILAAYSPTLALAALLIRSVFSPLYTNAYTSYAARRVKREVLSSFYGGLNSISALTALLAPWAGYALWSANKALPFAAYIAGMTILSIYSLRVLRGS